MERYGRTQAMEGAQADPVAEWSSPIGETGLEEPMWQLGLTGGVESYPERPDEADCIYYLRTGFCGFGARCRFNHPRDRHSVLGALRGSGGEYPERTGQPVCQYYMRTGMCKFGISCKYHHPKHGAGSVNPMVLNLSGYPLRPGEKECSYYVKTGQCKFGVTCKFHHPQPSGIQIPAPPIYQTMQSTVQSSQQYGVVAGNWPATRSTMLPGSFVSGTYGPPMVLPPGMVPVPGWSPYLAPVSPAASPSTTQPTVGGGAMFGIQELSSLATTYAGPYLSLPSSSPSPSGFKPKENPLPERPGQPECQHYMKTGDCKFGSFCRYHHPPKTSYDLSLTGLPLRPGFPICSHYAQTGACNFGPSCIFDHPTSSLSYSPSQSSLVDIPVAPYPVGSTAATLAPSSSSADLRAEPEPVAQISSSMITSTASVGSIFSTSGIAAQSLPIAGQECDVDISS